MRKAVFCHAMWRTGSTFLFNAFRNQDSYLCFYEPFHEYIGSKRALAREREQAEIRAARLRHPVGAGSNFYAFHSQDAQRDLIPIFPYEASVRCVLNKPSKRTVAYIKACQEHAFEHGKTPFFGFCRSGTQTPKLKGVDTAVHIHLWREPRTQFASYDWPNNRYFLPQTIAQLCHSRKLHHHLDRFPVKLQPREHFRRAISFRRYEPLNAYTTRLLEAISPAERYALFYLVWLVSRESASHVADVSINLDALRSDHQQREAIEALFSINMDGLSAQPRQADPSIDYSVIEKQVESQLAHFK
ncbi:MAG: hypothetical protein AAFR39_12380 [Pseudomonadota bacterium]